MVTYYMCAHVCVCVCARAGPEYHIWVPRSSTSRGPPPPFRKMANLLHFNTKHFSLHFYNAIIAVLTLMSCCSKHFTLMLREFCHAGHVLQGP
jgi:hypothetical protein